MGLLAGANVPSEVPGLQQTTPEGTVTQTPSGASIFAAGDTLCLCDVLAVTFKIAVTFKLAVTCKLQAPRVLAVPELITSNTIAYRLKQFASKLLLSATQ